MGTETGDVMVKVGDECALMMSDHRQSFIVS